VEDDTARAVLDAPPTDGEPTIAAESATLLPLAILETVLSRSGSWGVTEVAQALGLPKARVHRHLANLRSAGYLSQNPASRRYEPGWRLVVLGQRIQATAQVVRLARPVMTELRDRIGQTVVLSALTTGGVSVTDVVAGGSPIDVILSPGTVFQYNSSAQGKVALAFASPRQLAVWSTLVNEQRTPRTVLDATQLWNEVNAAREQGWADGPEETFLGVNAIAAPVFDNNSDIAYALAVVGSIHYIANPPPAELVNAVLLAAADLSKKLGQQSGNMDHARHARDQSD
jgi:DNA-binding IclR family transcriptional regulator